MIAINAVEPIRSLSKIKEIENYLRSEESPRNYLLFVLGINFALRISDLLSLKVKDARKEDSAVRQSLYLRESKTGKEKKIVINEAARMALEYYFSVVDAKQEDWLFPSESFDCAINRAWAWKLIQRWVRKVGLEGHYGSHSLRKSFGYHARLQGVSIELLQHKFNHSSPEVARRYIGITEDEIASIEQKINL